MAVDRASLKPLLLLALRLSALLLNLLSVLDLSPTMHAGNGTHLLVSPLTSTASARSLNDARSRLAQAHVTVGNDTQWVAADTYGVWDLSPRMPFGQMQTPVDICTNFRCKRAFSDGV